MARKRSSSDPPQSGPIPPAPETTEAVFASHQRHWRRDSLEQELAACSHELAAMRALLDYLPHIFEGKFTARLEPLLDQRQQLLEGNQDLRQELSRLQPGTTPIAGRLMAADPDEEAAAGGSRRQSLGRSLRHAFGLGDRPGA